MKQRVEVYGEGGFDPKKPNNNIVEEYEIEVPDPEPTAEDRLAHIEESIKQASSLADLKQRVQRGPRA